MQAVAYAQAQIQSGGKDTQRVQVCEAVPLGANQLLNEAHSPTVVLRPGQGFFIAELPIDNLEDNLDDVVELLAARITLDYQSVLVAKPVLPRIRPSLLVDDELVLKETCCLAYVEGLPPQAAWLPINCTTQDLKSRTKGNQDATKISLNDGPFQDQVGPLRHGDVITVVTSEFYIRPAAQPALLQQQEEPWLSSQARGPGCSGLGVGAKPLQSLPAVCCSLRTTPVQASHSLVGLVSQAGQSPVGQVSHATTAQAGQSPVGQVSQAGHSPVGQVFQSLLARSVHTSLHATTAQAGQSPVGQVSQALLASCVHRSLHTTTAQAGQSPVGQVSQTGHSPVGQVSQSLLASSVHTSLHATTAQAGQSPVGQVSQALLASSVHSSLRTTDQAGQSPVGQVSQAGQYLQALLASYVHSSLHTTTDQAGQVSLHTTTDQAGQSPVVDQVFQARPGSCVHSSLHTTTDQAAISRGPGLPQMGAQFFARNN